jgi:predicted dehydrogenase
MSRIQHAMTKQIKVGLVGCGQWGPNLVRNFQSLDECSLKVVCDVDPVRMKLLQSFYPGVECETLFDRMLGHPEVEAVIVAAPAKLHYPMAKASLLAGKHTLVEMPMASSAAQCGELIEIARERGLVLMVGHTFLFSEAVRKLKEIVDNREIGEIRYIAAQRLNMGEFQEGMNVAWDLAAHDISIILHLIKELPHSVVCRGAAHATPGTEGATSMSLYFANKREAIIRSSWHDSRRVRDMTIIGSKRMLVYDDISVREKVKILGARDGRPACCSTPEESLFSYSCGEIQLPDTRDDEPLKTECQHFLHCIRGGTTPFTGGMEGMEVVQVLEASSESLRLGGAPVSLGTAGRPMGRLSPGLVLPNVNGARLHSSLGL